MVNYTYYKLYSTTEEKEAYRKGYLQGYRAGYQDAKEGKSGIVMDSDAVAEIPIGAMGLSTRAYNCLFFAGCRYASDVAGLSGSQILQMRNLGKVTAKEIAGVLEKLGIRGTDGEAYFY
jgi:DNA-directed RNA polymerase alpha subunit